MRIIAGLLLFTAVSIFGQSTNTNFVTGQWDFDSGDLRATVGGALQFRGNTSGAASFIESTIAGQRARVLRLEELTPEQGLIMPHGASPNNGGVNVNQYTLILDVMWPTESDRTWRAILQSDTNNIADPILFVSSGNGFGINNDYATTEIRPNTWYRLAAVFDLTQTNSTLRKYINGVEFAQTLANNSRDREFSLLPTALLFTGALGDSAPVLINSLQFRSAALTSEEIQELGLPGAGGISGGGGLPLEDVRIESIRREGSEIVLTVSGGGNLQLQRSGSVHNPNWQNVGASSSSGTFRVPIADPVAFFRVQRL